MINSEKVIVGLSGGVDSSVTALLLQAQGYDVHGLFMKNWDERLADGECLWQADVEDAMRVVEKLGIPMNTLDLSVEYRERVFSRFIEAHRRGRTPNPDVLCNQTIKFSAFLEHALTLDAKYIATGHYARIEPVGGILQLNKGADDNKDQSYFLCRLNQAQLRHSLFPIGGLKKAEVRRLAKQAGLATHDKKDSTGICFIGERPFKEFLSRYLPTQPGEIKSATGETVGRHDGVFYYTLGQRRGLGIGGVSTARDGSWYVYKKDIEHNLLWVVQGHDHPLLMNRQLVATELHWISGEAPVTPFRCRAKTRYRQVDQDCTIDTITDDLCTVTFRKPQRAVTPGQFVVFYDGDSCLGGGVIVGLHNL